MILAYRKGEYFLDGKKVESAEEIGQAVVDFMGQTDGFVLNMQEATFQTSTSSRTVKVMGATMQGREEI